MMFDKLRRLFVPNRTAAPVTEPAASPGSPGRSRQPNLFEAAAVYVAATADDDQDLMDEASGWVSPEALSFGVSELACRAVTALARERDESPRTVARSLLGLPAA